MWIDVSHFQASINFGTVAKDPQGIQGVYIKATQGVGYVDNRLVLNANGASNALLKFGFYHYATLGMNEVKQDAIDEANFFADTIKKLPKSTLPVALDIEENKPHRTRKEVAEWITQFFAQLEKRNINDYILYSGKWFLDSNIPPDHKLGTIRLWLAQYVNKPQPSLPIGWNKYHLWQYSDRGKVNGIPGFVDVSRKGNDSL